GKNIGKYSGETIDIQRVLAEMETAAQAHGWNEEVFLKTESYKLIALTRKAARPSRRIYISAGIHGDEPAGPLAVLQLLQENRWPADADLWLCPCLNPTGFPLNTRENARGLDLNRQYLAPEAEETRAHIAWLERQPNFDVCLCLHEDWESAGFYVYELNPDRQPSFAQAIIQRVSEVCPIDLSSTIEDRPAANGIINPNVDPRSRPQWPEAFYLFTYKTRLSYTMEAPSDYQLVTRVAALVAAVRAVTDGQR
ncbi:MAG TPA: M14 family metallocarboxypeptidase, partial [Verrucomicrobiae bacterium]|nr:M14 family metallocarboxypeptidase [Verrucomicrobiae bacterium]